MSSNYFNKLTALTLTCFALSIALSVISVYHAAGYLNKFSIWVAGPYVVLLPLPLLPFIDRRKRDIAGAVTGAVLLFLTYGMYIADDSSSTGAIIYLYGPMYVLVGGCAIWLVTFVFVSSAKTRTGKSTL